MAYPFRAGQKEELKALANSVMGIVNGGNDAVYEYFVDKLMRSHRTLQQSLMRNILIPLIRKWAEAHDNKWFDLRNEATCDLSKQLSVVIDKYENDHGLPYV